ncbi:DUF2513 domain-containing protein [Clostridium botulinum]|uniref:DUF2513 domain-containing protein n=1 Tax=Clostridium botulinum TaxID=1491 RepID=UPI0009943C81|nr:DUF2513 domain-containing protein [Clostridium botulinum]NFO98770.1 DUF2513 domain-containing protein [Clostridium botulinum]OOV52314.1 hypothetical protein B1A66_04705 [Clostridium botulinum D/C]OOV54082.1 hypothetical protein B0673_11510 [Clostridium botulinum D/C]OOV58082.1 hypothetical protein B1A67_03545 [Clostridium botulinum D/C]
MKRDMELIRKILLYIEKNYVDVVLYNIDINGYEFKTIAYHCKLCYKAGLICNYGDCYDERGITNFGIGSLTWDGHEFLEKIKDETIWNKTKKIMQEKGIKFTIKAIEQIASKLVEIGISTAIKSLT